MSRNRIDLLPVNLRELMTSAFHRGWVKLGMGVHLRARESAEGYDVRIRYGKDDVIKKSSIRVGDRPIGTRGTLRRSLICAGCAKATTKNLYLGGDFRFFCSQCLGVDPWKVRVPMKWPLSEEVKFRQLLRRKIDQDILTFELAAMRTLTPEEFFKSRPYLVPEWLERLRHLDPVLHHKLLKPVHDKYRSVMMRRRVRYLSERESSWLMDKMQEVMSKSYRITKKEMIWLKNRQPQLNSGSQLSSKSDPSSLQLTEIDCSSKRMSSGQDMNAKPVLERASESVDSVQVEGATNGASESSNAPPVKAKEE